MDDEMIQPNWEGNEGYGVFSFDSYRPVKDGTADKKFTPELFGAFPDLSEEMEKEITISIADYNALIPKAHVLERLDRIKSCLVNEYGETYLDIDSALEFIDQLKKELS